MSDAAEVIEAVAEHVMGGADVDGLLRIADALDQLRAAVRARLDRLDPAGAAGEQSVVIQIPEGYRPGRGVRIQLADGRSHRVRVPEGYEAGDSLTVEIPDRPGSADRPTRREPEPDSPAGRAVSARRSRSKREAAERARQNKMEADRRAEGAARRAHEKERKREEARRRQEEPRRDRSRSSGRHRRA